MSGKQQVKVSEGKRRSILLNLSMESQIEEMRMHCVDKCFDLHLEDINPQEKSCYVTCMKKAQTFVNRANEVYKSLYF